METNGLITAGAAGLDWLRGPARIENDNVILEPSTAEPYRLAPAESILYDLAAITHRADVLGFVRRYGLLWHGPGLTYERDAGWSGPGLKHFPLLGDTPAPELGPDDTFREPLNAWMNLATELATILRHHEALQRALLGDPPALSELRKAFGGLHKPPLSNATLLFGVGALIAQEVSGETGALDAQYLLVTSPSEPGKFVLAPACPGLAGYPWLFLARVLVDRTPLRTCEECGRVFAPRDQRQRYHDGTCAGRVRQRRFAEKKKLGA